MPTVDYVEALTSQDHCTIADWLAQGEGLDKDFPPSPRAVSVGPRAPTTSGESVTWPALSTSSSNWDKILPRRQLRKIPVLKQSSGS